MGGPGGARRSPFDLALKATGIMLVMTIQAVVFDIGGVLEITPDLGVTGMWESRLGLGPGELNKRMYDVWHGGSIGTVSELPRDRQHRPDRVRSPAASAIPHGDPE